MSAPGLAPVSVVIPCWCCADTVARAVRSALGQTLMPAEIILVDDHSADYGRTRAALHALVASHKSGGTRFELVRLPANSGPGGARNAGWACATQRYVAFLDADDAWHPQKLEIQTRWMTAHPEVVLTGHASVPAPAGAPMPVTAEPAATPVTVRQMLISNRFPTRSVMLRRELPFRFRDRRHAEDYLLWLEIVCAGHAAWRLEAPLAFHFRPEFARGGYSGQLWTHEKRELAALSALRRERRIGVLTHAGAAAWSLAKYLRRVAIGWTRPRMESRDG